MRHGKSQDANASIATDGPVDLPKSPTEVLQTGPVVSMLLTRLAFWLALLPSFARCLVDILFPSVPAFRQGRSPRRQPRAQPFLAS
jgi:hypothetical protein